jgi:hypothetical protein
VRLFTRRGYDWTARYPAIAAAAAKLRSRSFTLDGEAVVCGPDGVAVFDALHHRWKATDAMLYAFDRLELDGEDLRPLPLGERKAKLPRLLVRKPAAIVFNEHTEEDGATVLRHACKLGFEGIVSKRPNALPQQFEIGKAHLPRRRPRHGSTHRAENRRPQPSRTAAHRATDGIGRLYGVAANHLSNERHRTSSWQVKLVAEKRWKRPFHRIILPFATETS